MLHSWPKLVVRTVLQGGKKDGNCAVSTAGTGVF